jgi:hypothetical protein
MTADHNRLPSKTLAFSTPEDYRRLLQVPPLLVCSVPLMMSLFLYIRLLDVFISDCGRLKRFIGP